MSRSSSALAEPPSAPPFRNVSLSIKVPPHPMTTAGHPIRSQSSRLEVMSPLGAIFQPFIYHHVPSPALIQFTLESRLQLGQLRMALEAPETAHFRQSGVVIDAYFQVRIA